MIHVGDIINLKGKRTTIIIVAEYTYDNLKRYIAKTLNYRNWYYPRLYNIMEFTPDYFENCDIIGHINNIDDVNNNNILSSFSDKIK